MSQPTETKPVWTKPELIRLGRIADVAGPTGTAGQSGPNARS
jgi:hypothetical protein